MLQKDIKENGSGIKSLEIRKKHKRQQKQKKTLKKTLKKHNRSVLGETITR